MDDAQNGYSSAENTEKILKIWISLTYPVQSICVRGFGWFAISCAELLGVSFISIGMDFGFLGLKLVSFWR